jgi:hypothetical protein
LFHRCTSLPPGENQKSTRRTGKDPTNTSQLLILAAEIEHEFPIASSVGTRHACG